MTREKPVFLIMKLVVALFFMAISIMPLTAVAQERLN